MDIRTKLVLSLVAASLVSMTLLALFAYQASAQLLDQISRRQLNAIAESQANDLANVLDGWRDSVRLLRSRTQLRRHLARYLETGDEQVVEDITRILIDAREAVTEVLRVALFTPEGELVTVAGNGPAPPRYRDVDDPERVHYGGTDFEAEEVDVVLYTLVTQGGRVIGQMEVVFDAEELSSVTGNYTGLGETGESLVVKRDGDRMFLLNPVRHEAGVTPGVPLVRPTPLMDRALSGEGGEPALHLDYRGEQVIAATRFLSDVDWGLVVKIDRAEEAQRANTLGVLLRDLTVSLSAFAVVGGTLLGMYLARPIRRLSDVVHRVRAGETTLRAEVRGDDEVAYLAESVNALVETYAGRGPRPPDA